MAAWYYFDDKGNPIGPFKFEAFRMFAANGTVGPETIIQSDEGKRSKVGNIKGLRFKEKESIFPTISEIKESFTSPPIEEPDHDPQISKIAEDLIKQRKNDNSDDFIVTPFGMIKRPKGVDTQEDDIQGNEMLRAVESWNTLITVVFIISAIFTIIGGVFSYGIGLLALLPLCVSYLLAKAPLAYLGYFGLKVYSIERQAELQTALLEEIRKSLQPKEQS